jgi:hypothetical protein
MGREFAVGAWSHRSSLVLLRVALPATVGQSKDITEMTRGFLSMNKYGKRLGRSFSSFVKLSSFQCSSAAAAIQPNMVCAQYNTRIRHCHQPIHFYHQCIVTCWNEYNNMSHQ